jgi:hypothetical protein
VQRLEKIQRRGELQKELQKLAKKCEIEDDIDEMRLIMPQS